MREQVAVVIHAPLEVVWAHLIDVERWPRTSASFTRVERLDHAAFQAGSRARITQPGIPRLVWTVSKFEPMHSFVWSATTPGATTVGGHELEKLDPATTRFTLWIERGGPLASLVDRLTRGMTLRYITMEAEGMRRVCEAHPDPTATAA